MGKPLQQDEEGKIINDTETKKAQKGYATYEKDQKEAQRKLDAEDAKVKETVKHGVEKIKGIFGMKKGGSVSSASSRADGVATKGKTKGRFV